MYVCNLKVPKFLKFHLAVKMASVAVCCGWVLSCRHSPKIPPGWEDYEHISVNVSYFLLPLWPFFVYVSDFCLCCFSVYIVSQCFVSAYVLFFLFVCLLSVNIFEISLRARLISCSNQTKVTCDILSSRGPYRGWVPF